MYNGNLHFHLSADDTACVFDLAKLILFAHPSFLIVFGRPEGIYFVLVKSLMGLKMNFDIYYVTNTLDLEISNSGYIKLSLAHSAIIRIICSNFVVHTASIIASSFSVHYTGLSFSHPCCSVLVILYFSWVHHG